MKPIRPIAGWTYIKDAVAFKRWHARERITYPGEPREYPCWAKEVFDSTTDTTTTFLYFNAVNRMTMVMLRATAEGKR